MNEINEPYHLRILRREFERRKAKRATFSLRQFARLLDVDPSSISRMFKRKSDVTIKLASLVLKKFDLTDEEKTLFIESLADERRAKTVAYLQACVEESR